MQMCCSLYFSHVKFASSGIVSVKKSTDTTRPAVNEYSGTLSFMLPFLNFTFAYFIGMSQLVGSSTVCDACDVD